MMAMDMEVVLTHLVLEVDIAVELMWYPPQVMIVSNVVVLDTGLVNVLILGEVELEGTHPLPDMAVEQVDVVIALCGSDRFANRYVDDRYDGGRYADDRYGGGRDRYTTDRYPPTADRFTGDRYGGSDRYASSGLQGKESYERDGGRSGGTYYRDEHRSTGGYERGGMGSGDRYGTGGPARIAGSYRDRPAPYDRPNRAAARSYEDRY
ncbi:hypothetical protein GUJ93_ZPchr0007g3511 [Zizania palustris]|uniref:Uncharacterized protein n=1 Tax=Zizania palustris TaxID=103762 RepID=A0A8J5TA23_ZIZPA|nr:hypothetical protein GUJ93_ZPchr0007g3511 [Zizania palustris]